MAKKLDTFLGLRLNPTTSDKHKAISEFMTIDGGTNECYKATKKSKTEFIIDALYNEIMRIKTGSVPQVLSKPAPAVQIELPEIDLEILPIEEEPGSVGFDNTAKDALSSILNGW